MQLTYTRSDTPTEILVHHLPRRDSGLSHVCTGGRQHKAQKR